MEKIHVLWNLFAVTGNIDAYLLYRDCLNEREKQEISEVEAEPM